jgi:hypothetical protein
VVLVGEELLGAPVVGPAWVPPGLAACAAAPSVVSASTDATVSAAPRRLDRLWAIALAKITKTPSAQTAVRSSRRIFRPDQRHPTLAALLWQT